MTSVIVSFISPLLACFPGAELLGQDLPLFGPWGAQELGSINNKCPPLFCCLSLLSSIAQSKGCFELSVD